MVGAVSLTSWVFAQNSKRSSSGNQAVPTNVLPTLIHKDPIVQNGVQMIVQGRQIFRFDTFGDEAFWGDALMLHLAIEGANFGGVGAGISPATALALGLKVDADALSQKLIQQLKQGRVDLNDPAVTLALLKEHAVVGVKGSFKSDGSLRSVGLTGLERSQARRVEDRQFRGRSLAGSCV